MYIISQDEYDRIAQNREGNLKIVPKNAEPPNVDTLNKLTEVVEISDGITKTEFEKDQEALAEKELKETLPPHAVRAVKSSKEAPTLLKANLDRIKKDPIKIVVVVGAAALLLYLLLIWKPASAK